MFLIHAKHDCFLETIAALFQKVRDFLGDKLGAVVNDERAVEILGVVYAVFNLVPVPVNIALSGL
jgi:hypothetical protein